MGPRGSASPRSQVSWSLHAAPPYLLSLPWLGEPGWGGILASPLFGRQPWSFPAYRLLFSITLQALEGCGSVVRSSLNNCSDLDQLAPPRHQGKCSGRNRMRFPAKSFVSQDDLHTGGDTNVIPCPFPPQRKVFPSQLSPQERRQLWGARPRSWTNFLRENQTWMRALRVRRLLSWPLLTLGAWPEGSSHLQLWQTAGSYDPQKPGIYLGLYYTFLQLNQCRISC